MLAVARPDAQCAVGIRVCRRKILQQYCAVECVERAAEYRRTVVRAREQRDVETCQRRQALREVLFHEYAAGQPCNRRGLSNRNGDHFIGVVESRHMGWHSPVGHGEPDQLRVAQFPCADRFRTRQYAAVCIEEEGKINLGAITMGAEQFVDRGDVPALHGAAEPGICCEHSACRTQPRMAADRELTGDGGCLVQDLVGPVRDLPVGGQQYRADGAELGKDDEQSRKRQDF